LLQLDNINKVDIIGAQNERIYVEMSDRKLAALGIDPMPIFSLLAAQNAMESAGVLITSRHRVPLRVEGTSSLSIVSALLAFAPLMAEPSVWVTLPKSAVTMKIHQRSRCATKVRKP